MNKIFFSLALITGIVSAKPLDFCEHANKLSEVAVKNYVVPIVDKTLVAIDGYEECKNFSQVLERYKKDLVSNNIAALQSNFKEFIYLHEVLDRFFRAIVDRKNYHAIDVVLYFIGLFNEFFNFSGVIEVQEGQNIQQMITLSDDFLIKKYYDSHNSHYKSLYECFNHSVRGKDISEIDIHHLHGFNVRVALDTHIDLLTVIRYHADESPVLKEIFNASIHIDLLGDEQKARVLHALAEDEKLWKNVCYHYAEIAALSDFLSAYIKNLNTDNISINLFWSFLTYINDMNKNDEEFNIGYIDYLVATSFCDSSSVLYSLQDITKREMANLEKCGIVEENIVRSVDSM